MPVDRQTENLQIYLAFCRCSWTRFSFFFSFFVSLLEFWAFSVLCCDSPILKVPLKRGPTWVSRFAPLVFWWRRRLYTFACSNSNRSQQQQHRGAHTRTGKRRTPAVGQQTRSTVHQVNYSGDCLERIYFSNKLSLWRRFVSKSSAYASDNLQ